MEDVLLSPPQLVEQEYRELVQRLGSTEWSEREAASNKLGCSGSVALPWIEKDIKKMKDPEIRMRLIQARNNLKTWPDKIKRLKQVLAATYVLHADTLWKKRIGDTPKKGLDLRTKLFLSLLPVKTIKQHLSGTDEKLRLKIILTILFTHTLGETLQLDEDHGGSGYTRWVEELSKFDAQTVMDACAQLWTIELEPPNKDGAYYWTCRAESAKNGQATNVIQVSINRGSNGSHIVHFNVYEKTAFNQKGIGPFVSWKGTKRSGR